MPVSEPCFLAPYERGGCEFLIVEMLRLHDLHSLTVADKPLMCPLVNDVLRDGDGIRCRKATTWPPVQPTLIRLALPPAAAVLTLRLRSMSSRSSTMPDSPGVRPCRPTIGPGRPASLSLTARNWSESP